MLLKTSSARYRTKPIYGKCDINYPVHYIHRQNPFNLNLKTVCSYLTKAIVLVARRRHNPRMEDVQTVTIVTLRSQSLPLTAVF